MPDSHNGISQHVAILRLKPGLLPIFLSMFLSLETGGQREIARVQYGQTKPGLNLQQIRGVSNASTPFKWSALVISQSRHFERHSLERLLRAIAASVFI
jgi:hypothetical protein